MSLWIKSYSVTIQMKAIEQYFPVAGAVYYAVHGGFNSWIWEKLGLFIWTELLRGIFQVECT